MYFRPGTEEEDRANKIDSAESENPSKRAYRHCLQPCAVFHEMYSVVFFCSSLLYFLLYLALPSMARFFFCSIRLFVFAFVHSFRNFSCSMFFFSFVQLLFLFAALHCCCLCHSTLNLPSIASITIAFGFDSIADCLFVCCCFFCLAWSVRSFGSAVVVFWIFDGNCPCAECVQGVFHCSSTDERIFGERIATILANYMYYQFVKIWFIRAKTRDTHTQTHTPNSNNNQRRRRKTRPCLSVRAARSLHISSVW